MKAAVLHGKELVVVEDLPPQALRRGEVRIAIEAALTCGTDLKVYKRGYHAKMIVPPAIFGHELSGTISELGSDVVGWKLGDRVVVANSAPCSECLFCRNHQENLCDDLLFLNGAYAESIVVPGRLVQKNLLRLRDSTPFAAAALTEPLACVVLGVEHCKVEAGQRALVIGAGPIGLMFVRLLAHRGCEVEAAGRGEGRLAAAKRLGASNVIKIEAAADTVKKCADARGPGYDLVVEAVGRPETWEAATQLVRKGGTVNFFGGCPSGTSVRFDTSLIHYSSLTLLASFHHTPRAIRRALELIESKVVHHGDFIDGDCPLSQLPELFRSMSSGNKAVKTLIRVHD
jgi:L-iditol 2-dehydrogenase